MSIKVAMRIDENTNRQYEKYDLPKLEQNIADTQIPIKAVQKFLSQPQTNKRLNQLEAEIDKEEINKSANIFHGERHIKNVVMFSILVGRLKGLDDGNLELLLQAAKYHDIGRERVGEGKIPHAAVSAEIAANKLKLLQKADLAVICAAIAFHEVQRGIYNEDAVFNDIINKYRVSAEDRDKTREISEILKDADALDRMRFGGRGRTKVELLKTETAKHLVQFAANLHEQFAIDDLSKLSNRNIKTLLQNLTPQEIQWSRKLQIIKSEIVKPVNIMLIGCGPHARRIHFPILQYDGEKVNARIKTIIDLESVSNVVREYLADKGFDLRNLVLLNKNESQIKDNNLLQELKDKLNKLVIANNINAVFICTEPTTHAAYAKWALDNNLNVLMDKPVSTPLNLATNEDAVRQISADYNEILQLYLEKKKNNPNLVFELMAQRRYHPAFQKLKGLITEVRDKAGVPITAFQTTHNDGQWRMPGEIVDQDYHPYNQGYGKCFHSGYHSIDIMNWLVQNSIADSSQDISKVEVLSNFAYPNDFIAQLPLENYNRLFGTNEPVKYDPDYLKKQFNSYGEIDAQISTAFKNGIDANITLGQFSLLHNSFGQRNWPTAIGRDLYKGNGRVRHETHNIVQGPFQTILYQSLQSEEILSDKTEHSDVGGEYNLDIHIFRNSKIFPEWESYRKITNDDLDNHILKGYSRGHQEDARRTAIVAFIKSINEPMVTRMSDIETHKDTIGILEAAYKSALMKKRGENPLVIYDKRRTFIGGMQKCEQMKQI